MSEANGFPDVTWDPFKASLNARKHQVTFEEAATVFDDPLARTFGDPDHSFYEDRFVTVGLSYTGRLLLVAHADSAAEIRIISARLPTYVERQSYELE